MRNRNVCDFVFCGQHWTYKVARIATQGGGKPWQMHFCDKHTKPYQKGKDPYERRKVVVTKRGS